ncbi:cupin domain-containing protein [Phytopseudomonas dryadis]|uniref:Cupin n=1 Tax=Phytopseudomonas dryadis TaxID=2487520 RepID=A0ABY1Z8K4_9GAMM|nr:MULTISPECIES: cupin domain-containing protein [Pseudomonas]TBV07684.1 cupin [Pseudomonas dryadis]TBV19888.1 cupin [Pseudomonas sp. FRB 230]
MSNPLPTHVIDFANPARVDTAYRSQSWRHFVEPRKNAVGGIWAAGPHREHCVCDYDELCHLLEGRVRLTDAEGNSRTFEAGATFVVAAGFTGTWENLTPVRKVYLILGA